MPYNAIVERMIPDELIILERRLGDLSLLMITEISSDLETDNGVVSNDIKDGIAVSKSKLMINILNSVNRLKSWVNVLNAGGQQ
tara:strand:+ start:1457 stop:1708 length:252 start_codon:yes stop_codon:yes gene_type:complete